MHFLYPYLKLHHRLLQITHLRHLLHQLRQLALQINQLQINKLNNYDFVKNKKIIKFDRNEFDGFTIIKVNYVQSE